MEIGCSSDDIKRSKRGGRISGITKAGTMEVRLRRFDGGYRWFQIAAAPIHDGQASLVRWCGINTDIDDLKRSELKLREKGADLRTITDAIRQVIVVLAPDGTTLYANRVALDQTGLKAHELSDQEFFARAFHPEDLDRVREERRAGLLEGVPFELEMRARQKSGEYRWKLIQYNPLKDDRGRVIRWYATATDIDDQRKRKSDSATRISFCARKSIALRCLKISSVPANPCGKYSSR